MSKIYLPEEYLNKPCYVVNNDYIRVYETTNSNYNVVHDIYFKNDYMIKRNQASYNTNTLCDNINTYTSNIYYRYDFPQILLTFFLLTFICFWVPWKILLRIFRRWN